jgi:hypothetical protein
MTLIQNPANAAHWTDDAWVPGTAGTFAVIIGASRYPHLQNGDAPAAETYGLDQLRVSALTAHRFFRWLRDHYRHPAAPLAQVWMLLAPSAEERAMDPAHPSDGEFARHVAGPVVEPTVAACEQAIREWFHAMQQLPQPQAEASRAFFFFTGHGLEVTQEQQILLPSDYLRPPVSVPEDAIGVMNLRAGLAAIPVRDQFFFLDACRNDHQTLRALRLTGRHILSEPPAHLTFPERNLSILYGSAAGTQAWSPADPAEGPSIFGRALLEGLTADPPGIRVDCEGTPPVCAILTYSLHAFVRNRVRALLEERGAAVRQHVPLGGSRLEDPAVTRVDGPGRDEPPPRPPQPLPPPHQPEPAEGLDSEPPRPSRGPGAFFDVMLKNSVGWAPGGTATVHAPPSWYDVLRSEQVTSAFSSLQLRSLEDGGLLRDDAHLIHSVERDPEGRVFRVDLSLPSARGRTWMQLDTYELRLGCVLPGDRSGAPRYRIVLYREPGTRRITGMEVRLAPEQDNDLLRHAAALWDAYRSDNLRAVAQSPTMQHLRELLRGGVESPLAATVAGLILLRAGSLGKTDFWTNEFSTPDGVVIRAEQMLRAWPGNPAVRDEALGYARQAARRGLPATSEAVGYLSTLLSGDEFRDEAEWLAARLATFQSGGLFTAFMGPPDQVTYGLAQGMDDEEPASTGVAAEPAWG